MRPATLRRPVSVPARTSSRRPRVARPGLDALEDRVTPSTFYVTNTLDTPAPGSLRWAVSRANRSHDPAPTVDITPLVKGTITLKAGELPIRTGLTVEDVSGNPVTILQASPNARIFHVFNGPKTAAVTIAGRGVGTLTLSGGQVVNGNGGAILDDNPLGDLDLANVTVTGNSAIQVAAPRLALGGNGGGLYAKGSVTLDHSSVVGNSAIGPNGAAGQAGGVYTDRGITLVASHVDSNAARNAGGIFNVTGNVYVLDGSTVNGNSSSGNAFANGDLGGGGIGEELGQVTVSASQVSHNRTVGMYSGGIVLLLGGANILDGSRVDDNTNDGPGGGIAANFEGPVIVSGHSQVDGNTGAGFGGGIVNFSERYGISVLDHSRVDNNTLTDGETGALIAGLIQAARSPAFLSSGRADPTLSSALKQFAQVVNQRADAITSATGAITAEGNVEGGGGVATALTGPIVIGGGSEVNGNLAGAITLNPPTPGIGGGAFANQGPITVDGSVIDGNTATGPGGGIWNGRSLAIANSGVTDNQAGAPGGGIFNRGSFTSSNTTVAGNTPDNIAPPA